jgi:O-acetyl-ADP-ribose deacetylase
VAVARGLHAIAFPAISTGVYGYPLEEATRIALGELQAFLERDRTLDRVIAVCYSRADYETYQRIYKEMDSGSQQAQDRL